MPCMIDTEKEVSSKLYAKPSKKGRQRFLSSVPSCEIQCQNIRLRADVFTSISSPISLFFSQNQDVL